VKLKGGVKVEGVSPEIVLAIHAAETVYRERGYDFVVTSILDGKHSAKSLHYVGKAFDCRTRHVPAGERLALLAALKGALGAEFDVVLEKDHVHIELDPKPKSIPV
jgi:hypothetical protein